MLSKHLFNLVLAWEKVPTHPTTYGCDQQVLKNGLCETRLPSDTISHSWAQGPWGLFRFPENLSLVTSEARSR